MARHRKSKAPNEAAPAVEGEDVDALEGEEGASDEGASDEGASEERMVTPADLVEAPLPAPPALPRMVARGRRVSTPAPVEAPAEAAPIEAELTAVYTVQSTITHQGKAYHKGQIRLTEKQARRLLQQGAIVRA